MVVNPLVVNHTEYCRQENRMLFPIIPRKWVELTGRWSNNGACDSWIELISNELHISLYEDDIKIYHDRFNLTGNNLDEIYTESVDDKKYIFHNFFTEEQHNERKKDSEIIRAYLNTL
jgi:hypothetical protein